MLEAPTETAPAETEAPAPAAAAPASPQTTSSRTTVPQGSKIIVGLMGVTILFAVVGEEIQAVQVGKGTASQAGTIITGAPKIFVGGAVATVLLTLLTHAGDGGRQLAVGLALLAMLSATLVYGGPVWDTLSTALGSKPTGTTGNTTPGTNTAASAATIATNTIA